MLFTKTLFDQKCSPDCSFTKSSMHRTSLETVFPLQSPCAFSPSRASQTIPETSHVNSQKKSILPHFEFFTDFIRFLKNTDAIYSFERFVALCLFILFPVAAKRLSFGIY
ncbi:hypothetical protein CEXT_137751 [Caerostris extrusa]|uniref:Uncharacterized protein n=1 Tax=Caerostris extrusa TaxID=172846 RepID=A0AAV4S9U6_CAEEX|nr:hypothetical protein CEXT_137751 [Caerostris extrusa]